jgi:hypothetical protein
VDVDVGHSGHHGAVALVDYDRAGRSNEAVLDRRNSAVLDDDGRGAALGPGGVYDQAPGLDRLGLGRSRRGEQQSRRGGKSLQHRWNSPSGAEP